MNCNFLEWSEQFGVGVRQLDDGHKELIDLYNGIVWVCEQDLNERSVCERLRSFVSCARHHFAEEEDYMLTVHYDDYVQHKSEHDRVLQDAEDFIENLNGALTLPDGQAIIKYLKYWLLRHIMTRDAELRKFARKPYADRPID